MASKQTKRNTTMLKSIPSCLRTKKLQIHLCRKHHKIKNIKTNWCAIGDPRPQVPQPHSGVHSRCSHTLALASPSSRGDTFSHTSL